MTKEDAQRLADALARAEAEAKVAAVEALADDEFANDETTDLPEWGGDFERGAMWAFAEAARLLSAALASVGRTEVSSS